MGKNIFTFFIMFFLISMSAHAQHEHMDHENMQSMSDEHQGMKMDMKALYGPIPRREKLPEQAGNRILPRMKVSIL